MNEFKKIGKKMPYSEKENYVYQLVTKSTEQAISFQHHKHKLIPSKIWIAAAAILPIIFYVGFALFTHQDKEPHNLVNLKKNVNVSSIDKFLNELTDEEAQMLDYYELEEIPEY